MLSNNFFLSEMICCWKKALIHTWKYSVFCTVKHSKAKKTSAPTDDDMHYRPLGSLWAMCVQKNGC